MELIIKGFTCFKFLKQSKLTISYNLTGQVKYLKYLNFSNVSRNLKNVSDNGNFCSIEIF